MKKGKKKRAYELFALSFFEFEIGTSRFSSGGSVEKSPG